MSLHLANSKPDDLEIKTWGPLLGDENTVYLGDYEISLTDFLEAAAYVLQNTSLMENDPRLEFVLKVQDMNIVDGFNKGESRLEFKND